MITLSSNLPDVSDRLAVKLDSIDADTLTHQLSVEVGAAMYRRIQKRGKTTDGSAIDGPQVPLMLKPVKPAAKKTAAKAKAKPKAKPKAASGRAAKPATAKKRKKATKTPAWLKNSQPKRKTATPKKPRAKSKAAQAKAKAQPSAELQALGTGGALLGVLLSGGGKGSTKKRQLWYKRQLADLWGTTPPLKEPDGWAIGFIGAKNNDSNRAPWLIAADLEKTSGKPVFSLSKSEVKLVHKVTNQYLEDIFK